MNWNSEDLGAAAVVVGAVVAVAVAAAAAAVDEVEDDDDDDVIDDDGDDVAVNRLAALPLATLLLEPLTAPKDLPATWWYRFIRLLVSLARVVRVLLLSKPELIRK